MEERLYGIAERFVRIRQIGERHLFKGWGDSFERRQFFMEIVHKTGAEESTIENGTVKQEGGNFSAEYGRRSVPVFIRMEFTR